MAPNPITSTGGAVHPDLEKTANMHSHSNVPDEDILTSQADAELLGNV